MSEELTPITRIEEYLDGIVNGGAIPLEPVTRVESFLDSIYNNQVCALTPVTRIETYLAKISGASVTLPDAPVTRIEQYLAKIAGEDVAIPDEPVTRIEEWLAEWANGGSPEYATVTGSIASFVTLRSAPLKELVVDIEPVQSGSGDPSPDNVRPISGWTGCDITQYGKNRCGTMEQGTVTENSSAGTAYTNMQSSSTTRLRSVDLIRVGAGNTVSISFDATNYRVAVVGFDSNKKYLGRSDAWRSFQSTSPQTVAWANAEYLAVILKRKDEGTIQPSERETAKLQLEIGTATDYEPYTGTTYSISWQSEAGTVYGGQLTVNEDGSGVLKSRPYYASYNGEPLVGPWVSSMDKYVSGATPTTGAQVVDLGGTETSTNLTPGQVAALLGQNYVWSDTGDVSVTYYYPGTTASPIVGVGTVNNMVI